MDKKYYIAYGSNLNLPQMERRCPTAKKIGSGEIKDYQLLFRGNKESAVATIEPSEGDTVPALIWELQKGDEESLDRYEGVSFFYHKEFMKIEINEESSEAIVYIMNDGYEIGMPSDYYLNTILDGYDTAGFEPTAIEKALEISKNFIEQNSNFKMNF